jgi:hypothetical protein
VKERPILFSGPMVRALLAGTKTVTRRICKPQPWSVGDQFSTNSHEWLMLKAHGDTEWKRQACPYGAPGDRLWVRERMRVLGHRQPERGSGQVQLRYEADAAVSPWVNYPTRLASPVIGKCLAYGGHREASRITLEVASVRCERLQDITEEDARAEGVSACDRCAGSGIDPVRVDGVDPEWCSTCGGGAQGLKARDAFAELWDQINGKRASWASNCWVWVVGFRRLV